MDLLIKGGGHPMAGGFSIETNKLDILRMKYLKSIKNPREIIMTIFI